MRSRPFWILAVFTGIAALWALPVRAEITFDEAVCQTKADLAAWKFVASKTACLISCQRAVRKGEVDPATCVPPYPPGSTHGCIQSKEGRANGRICRVCNPDAPECYPGICSETTTELLTLVDEAYVGSFLPGIYCDDSTSPDGLTALEGKCQDAVAKYLVKYAYGRAKCYAKCRLNEFKGVLAPGSCVPPASDPVTLACIANLEPKAALRIDRYCNAPYDEPECDGNDYPNGSSWVTLMGLAVDGFEPTFYCETP